MDLTFQVYDWTVHPELIEAVAVRTFERDDYRLRVHLTAAGHLFDWRWKGLVLVEALAEQPRLLQEQRMLLAHRVGNERSERLALSARVSYQTCFQLERMTPELFFRFHDQLRCDGEKNGLLHLLHPLDRMGLSPLSYLDLQARPRSLLIHAFHTYPAEFAVVKSQSLIEIGEAPFSQPGAKT